MILESGRTSFRHPLDEYLLFRVTVLSFLTCSSASVPIDEPDEGTAPHSGAFRVLLDVLEVFLDEEGRQHVQLLDPQRRGPLLRLLLGQVGEQAGRLQEVVGLAVQLDRLDYLVLVQKVLRVLRQQTRNLFSISPEIKLHSYRIIGEHRQVL